MRVPSYRALSDSGELEERVSRASDMLSPCSLCPRKCGADRAAGERGACHAGILPAVAAFCPHYGEERPLSGKHGSGTIFFTHCNLRCVYCQNHTISQQTCGREISCEDLADIMLELQEARCHNINLVSPTHVVPQILSAVEIAARKGLNIPLVYNTGTYDSLPALRLLEGVVDIYLPDTKYGKNEIGAVLSQVPDYTTVMKAALQEMHRQVGDLVCDHGLGVRGLLIRHLLLPANLSESAKIMHFIATRISLESYVNIMDQYRPDWRVLEKPDDPVIGLLNRPITRDEYSIAVGYAKREGLHRGIPDRIPEGLE
ncbi:MAG TPA: radical SAM protein [Methanoregulaceae archaeon]|nr:radical SAM protein [Methanoregulaceae archaeon]